MSYVCMYVEIVIVDIIERDLVIAKFSPRYVCILCVHVWV